MEGKKVKSDYWIQCVKVLLKVKCLSLVKNQVDFLLTVKTNFVLLGI